MEEGGQESKGREKGGRRDGGVREGRHRGSCPAITPPPLPNEVTGLAPWTHTDDSSSSSRGGVGGRPPLPGPQTEVHYAPLIYQIINKGLPYDEWATGVRH